MTVTNTASGVEQVYVTTLGDYSRRRFLPRHIYRGQRASGDLQRRSSRGRVNIGRRASTPDVTLKPAGVTTEVTVSSRCPPLVAGNGHGRAGIRQQDVDFPAVERRNVTLMLSIRT